MKKILLPYDFSEAAINALNYTKNIFQGFDLEIYLLDVYTANKASLVSKEMNESWFNEMDNEIEDEMNYLLEVLHGENKGFTYHGIVESDSFVKAIKNVIEKHHIDLIVSGTKGLKSVAQNITGTNTFKVINNIDTIPVLVVPVNFTYKKMQKVVFSTSYKRPFYTKELTLLLDMCVNLNYNLEVVNLTDEENLTNTQKEHKKQLENILEVSGNAVSYKKIFWDESETTTLEHYIEETTSTLLVLINHKYSFLNSFLEENVVKKSTLHSKIPLLILPENNG